MSPCCCYCGWPKQLPSASGLTRTGCWHWSQTRHRPFGKHCKPSSYGPACNMPAMGSYPSCRSPSRHHLQLQPQPTPCHLLCLAAPTVHTAHMCLQLPHQSKRQHILAGCMVFSCGRRTRPSHLACRTLTPARRPSLLTCSFPLSQHKDGPCLACLRASL